MFLGLGLCYFSTGKVKKAKEIFEKTLTLVITIIIYTNIQLSIRILKMQKFLPI